MIPPVQPEPASTRKPDFLVIARVVAIAHLIAAIGCLAWIWFDPAQWSSGGQGPDDRLGGLLALLVTLLLFVELVIVTLASMVATGMLFIRNRAGGVIACVLYAMSIVVGALDALAVFGESEIAANRLWAVLMVGAPALLIVLTVVHLFRPARVP